MHTIGCGTPRSTESPVTTISAMRRKIMAWDVLRGLIARNGLTAAGQDGGRRLGDDGNLVRSGIASARERRMRGRARLHGASRKIRPCRIGFFSP